MSTTNINIEPKRLTPSVRRAQQDRITVAYTGASGIQYGLRLVQYLLQSGYGVDLLISRAAIVVMALELDLNLGGNSAQQRVRLLQYFGIDEAKEGQLLRLYGENEWTAPLASGSNCSDVMVVCPATVGALGAIATGQSNNLIERAADVILKERKELIMVVRETPFNEIHLQNMLTLSRMGALIMPANPGFYHRPERVEDLIDFMVARILDQIGIPHNLMVKWGD